jgi:hypothetical protein
VFKLGTALRRMEERRLMRTHTQGSHRHQITPFAIVFSDYCCNEPAVIGQESVTRLVAMHVLCTQPDANSKEAARSDALAELPYALVRLPYGVQRNRKRHRAVPTSMPQRNAAVFQS